MGHSAMARTLAAPGFPSVGTSARVSGFLQPRAAPRP
ncbi:hypothetical protein COSO111634_28405 [Corallococcus soli]